MKHGGYSIAPQVTVGRRQKGLALSWEEGLGCESVLEGAVCYSLLSGMFVHINNFFSYAFCY